MQANHFTTKAEQGRSGPEYRTSRSSYAPSVTKTHPPIMAYHFVDLFKSREHAELFSSCRTDSIASTLLDFWKVYNTL